MAAEGARRALTWKKHEGSPRELGRACDRAGRTSKGAGRTSIGAAMVSERARRASKLVWRAKNLKGTLEPAGKASELAR